MTDHHDPHPAEHRHGNEPDQPATRPVTRSRLVLIGFLLVIGYFLWAEHRAHVIEFLPYVLLAACPLMHLFMHRGHGHGHGHDGGCGHGHDPGRRPPPDRDGSKGDGS